jgi:sugar O-acyltransferase (sialic acid O-acetyltransferase NeuD family)
MTSVRSVMLWGAGSQSRLIESMIDDLYLGSTTLIFDPVIEKSVFANDQRFTSDYIRAANKLESVTHFLVCIGNYAGYARQRTSEFLLSNGLDALSVIHSTAFIDHTAELGEGLQVMPGVIVQKFVKVGDWTIINTGAVVDHECQIGQGVHIMGGAAIAGRVNIGDYVSVGTNATILPDIRIGTGAIIGAGAVVASDVNPGDVVSGIPARFMKTSELYDPCDYLEKFASARRTTKKAL